MITIFANASVFDGVSEELREGSHVVVEGGTIREVATTRPGFADARIVECGGRFLMPGLIDAHFHAYTPSFDIAGIDRMRVTPPGSSRARCNGDSPRFGTPAEETSGSGSPSSRA